MTDFYQVKDRAYTTLASGLTDVALVTVYVSGGVFGSGNCILTCEDEKINQTARSGNWATISRGFGGTTAAVHAIGTPIALNVTAGVVAQLQSGVVALETSSGALCGAISIFVASSTATAAEKALATATYTCDGVIHA
jgi:hypothetical protein